MCLTGCTSEFEPDIDSTPVLCMNTVMGAGEQAEVKLSHTWRYSSRRPADVTVKDAVIAVWVNGRHMEDMSYSGADGNGNAGGYKMKYRPQHGDEVRLVADSREYGRAEAQAVVPEAPRVDTVKCNVIMEPEWCQVADNGFMAVLISMKLDMQMMVNDPAGVTNYYRLDWGSYVPKVEFDPENRHQMPYGQLQLGGFDYDAEPLFAEHINSLETVFGNDAYGFTAFSDMQIQGKVYPLNVRFKSCSIDISGMPEDLHKLYGCKVILRLYGLSSSLYKWYIHDWQTSEGVIGDLGSVGFADAICGYSNVSTHAGIVSATSYTDYEVDLAPYLKEFFENFKPE